MLRFATRLFLENPEGRSTCFRGDPDRHGDGAITEIRSVLLPLLPIDRPRPVRLLVSVRDAAEAEIACAAGADLIDAKDPARGALGGLPAPVVRAIVARVGARAATSAVAGEPETDEALVAAVAAMAAAGVDYIKVALRPEQAPSALTRAAAAAAGRLIGVFFAEDDMPRGAVARLAAAGFHGAMIDTRGKDGRRLSDLLSADRLADFLAEARSHRLLSGLAGSLRIDDIPSLAAHQPDYLGFRGGLCREGDRRNALDPMRVSAAIEALRASRRRDAA